MVLRSDKPQAEPFIEWVTSEVLPQIRLIGAYALPQAIGHDGFHTFDFDGHELVVYVVHDGSLWFRSNDISTALGYASLQQAALKLCDPRGRRHLRCKKRNGWSGSMVFIDEPNLFRLLIHSCKTGTDRLQRFFADVVLPSVRAAKTTSVACSSVSTATAIPEISFVESAPDAETSRRDAYIAKMYQMKNK